MTLSNTRDSYGTVTKTFHWLTALLIISNLPLGLIANDMAYDTGEMMAQKAQLFSLHKTLGVAIFAVALLRILWAITQPKPAHLDPNARATAFLADMVHWLLYASLLLVPLTGWISHAAATGYAPIWWPFGQTLPFVPQTEAVARAAGSAHWLFTKILAGSILLHVAGALKHHLIDRDDTLRRMLPGPRTARAVVHQRQRIQPAIAAFVVYAAGTVTALAISAPQDMPAPEEPVAAATTTALAGGQVANWQVQSGSIGFSVQQMGTPVTGSFADWTAAINFDEQPVDGVNGRVDVTISMASVTLGSVTEQAGTAEFFDVPGFPTATFGAVIRPAATGYVADGTLTLKGTSRPLQLAFAMEIAGDTATVTARTTLDRRDFGIAPTYGDESTVGFPVVVTIDLTATRD